MKVVCCYTNLRSETKASLPSNTLYYNVAGNDEGYFGIFNMLWGKKERFINIEHDIVVPESRLQELWDCPKPWCIVPYNFRNVEMDALVYALGVVKFHESVMENVPTLIRDTEKDNWPIVDGHLMFPPRYWQILDCRIARQMHFHGIGYHVHYLPGVQHLWR